jgi:Tfp pilus assembly protein PilF
MKSGKFWVALLVLFAIGFGCAQTNSRMKKQQTADAYYKLGIFYLENGNYRQAISEFRRALDMNPDDPNYYFSMGTAYSLEGEDEAAIKELKTALRLDPKYSEAHNNLGYIYAKKKRWAEAIAEFKAALANPDYGRPYSPHLNLAQCYLEQGDLETSIEEYRQALNSKPDSEIAHSGLARVYFRKGEMDLAVEEYEKALKFNDRQINLYYELAVVYLRKGDKEKGVKNLEKVIELDPKSPLAEDARKQLEDMRK